MELSLRDLLSSLLASGILFSCVAAETQTWNAAETKGYLPLMEQHFKAMATAGTDNYAPDVTGMWMSVLDTRTARPPKKLHTPQRVYRKIGAPQGSTLYWDQPLVVAAFELSRLTGEPAYRRAASAYVEAFLKRCVDPSGMFLWGNHVYYDAVKDEPVRFHGGHHELRPITPAWQLFWRHDRDKCSRYIRTMADRHIYDHRTGGFNRHDDQKRGHAFLESGGILVESLAWLHAKTGDRDLLRMALSIARYSYSHRGKTTGLIRNEPDHGRWDSKVSTTEVGLWARSLLRACDYSKNDEFLEMARSSVAAYLKYGFDEQTEQYYGQLRVESGQPVIPEEDGYWPREYSNIWETRQWPTHDYPMPLAEASVTLYAKTRDRNFLEGIRRWSKVIASQTPVNDGKGAYAEHYGRCIHFLTRAGHVLQDEKMMDQARVLANEAVTLLHCEKLFQGYPRTHLYESVDGVGFLFLALMFLETGKEPQMYGFGF